MIDLKEIPSLSVLDFVHDTDGMNEKDFVVYAESLKLRLKKLPIAKGQDLYCMGLEIEHLIDFIHKVCYHLYYRSSPAGLRDYDIQLYNEVIARYPVQDHM